MTLTLILGGARSGKTGLALRLAEARSAHSGFGPVLIATAEALDEEMQERIARHRAERGPHWTTVEAPLDLVGALAALPAGQVVLVDCLTLWLSNLMHAGRDLEAETAALGAALRGRPVILIANEVGLGIVPDNALARRFRDEAGTLNQRVAARADRVVFMVAGLPMEAKAR